MNDPKIPNPSKVNIDAELLQAYLANDDHQDAQTIVAEIKQLDPNSTPARRDGRRRLIKSRRRRRNRQENRDGPQVTTIRPRRWATRSSPSQPTP